ncbi:hypothetical protein ABZ250_38365 [Streptomyces afghaniensis]|uniref:hypothetical protein n=1 Tax=Streptomyces afghaniensis TaxID=66865 RepID=UPI00339EFD8A
MGAQRHLTGVRQGLRHRLWGAAGAAPRSRIRHRLGLWYEVTLGLDTGDQDAVRSGLDGVLDRLPGIYRL